jgi:predicted ATPase
VTSLTWLTPTLWALGYADQAQQRSQEALALARQVGHSLSVVYTELFAAMFSQCCRDMAATRAHADAAMALAAAQGLALRVEQGRLLRGWAAAMRGDGPAGVAQLRQWLAAVRGVGPRLMYPYWLSLMAEGYGRAGQPEAGLQALMEALTLIVTTEERWWEAQLYRLKGELLLRPYPRYPPNRSFVPSRPRPGPPAAGEGVGASLSVQSEPAVAGAGQARRGPAALSADLRLVRGGL